MIKKICISDTTLSDSSHALRRKPLSADELAPLAEALDTAGVYSAEVWGGSTFDFCLRYLNENPWERLRMFGRKLKNTPMRIIVRGQNLLGYYPVSMDIIKAFAEEVSKNGIKYARIFDPLNDISNLEHVISSFIQAGIEVEGTIVYTESPVHSIEGFAEICEQLIALGCKSLCVNDVAGMLTPQASKLLASTLSKIAPVSFHTRSISGMGTIAYTAAIQNGASGIDCTIGPFAVAAAQPTIESMMNAIEELGLETGLDERTLKAYAKAAEYIALKFAAASDEAQLTQSLISVHKIPVGMLAGISSELSAISAQNRLSEVLSEVTRIREDFGWPPLTTPISQLIAVQAIHNVLSGKRYEIMSREVREYFKGRYGTPPGEINPALLKNTERITGRASLLMEPMFFRLESELKKEGLYEAHEDVITYAIFGQTALHFFRKRKDPNYSSKVLQSIDNRLELLSAFMDKRKLRRLEISSKDFKIKLVKGFSSPAKSESTAEPVLEEHSSEITAEPDENTNLNKIITPLAGTFYRSPSPGEPPFAEEGKEVDEKTVIGLVEAMKLFHEIKADSKGILKKFLVQNETSVSDGQVLAVVEPSE